MHARQDVLPRKSCNSDQLGADCWRLRRAGTRTRRGSPRCRPMPNPTRNMTGSGTVTAVLDGTKLTIDGSFEGLKAKATTASLHDSVATGVRGPSIHDLTVATEMNGSITGSFNLTADQVEHLKKGRLVRSNSQRESR